MVQGKCLVAPVWARYSNKSNTITYPSLVDAVLLHHAVLYHPNLRHLDLNGKLNGKGIYHNFLTG